MYRELGEAEAQPKKAELMYSDLKAQPSSWEGMVSSENFQQWEQQRRSGDL